MSSFEWNHLPVYVLYMQMHAFTHCTAEQAKKKDVVYSDQRGETTVVIIPLVHCGTVIVDKDSSMGNLLRYLADAELRKQ